MTSSEQSPSKPAVWRPATLARITGRVQRVGFRAWTETEARSLGLAGWVRNEPDGSVTVLLAGSDEAVALMLERLQKGPRGARVTAVATGKADAAPASGFHIVD